MGRLCKQDRLSVWERKREREREREGLYVSLRERESEKETENGQKVSSSKADIRSREWCRDKAQMQSEGLKVETQIKKHFQFI